MIDEKQPFVSVVVPTFNRGQALCQALKSLLKQDYKNYEILVVDQSTKKFAIKEKFLKKYKAKLRLFRLNPPSLTAARNLGVKKAKGKIILFCDDDIVAGEGLVSAHAINYKDESVGAVTGRVITVGQKMEVDCRSAGQISPWGTVAGGFSSQIRQEVKNVFGCNLSWRRKVLKEAGGFDENFVGNALREETDMALRVSRLGWRIVFDPKAELSHLRAPTGGCRKSEGRLKWYHDFFHNETYFFLKHLNWFWWPIFWFTRWQYFLRSMFGFGREVSLRSLSTPWQGIVDGIKTYRRWQNENRC